MNTMRFVATFWILILLLTACSSTADDMSLESGPEVASQSQDVSGPVVTLRYEIAVRSSTEEEVWVSEFAGTPWTEWANVTIRVPKGATIEGASAPSVEYNDHGRVNKVYLSDDIDVGSAAPLEVVNRVADEQRALDNGVVRQSAMGDSASDWATPLPPGNAPTPSNSRVERADPRAESDYEIVSPAVAFSKMVAMNLAEEHPDEFVSVADRLDQWVPADIRSELSRSAVAERLGVGVEELSVHSAASRASCDMSAAQGGDSCTFHVAVVHQASDLPVAAYLKNPEGAEKVLRVTHFSSNAP